MNYNFVRIYASLRMIPAMAASVTELRSRRFTAPIRSARMLMSTDDCSVVGRTPCPCGKGEIVVEHCTPDHPWARDNQGWYNNTLSCEECELQYEIFQKEKSEKGRLVLREQAKRVRDATEKWHQTLRKIEASPAFKRLSTQLDRTLGEQRSAAAAHRLLVQAKLTYDSIGQYCRRGYKLSALHASEALTLFREHDADLEAMIAEASSYHKLMRETPVAIKTGNPGLAL